MEVKRRILILDTGAHQELVEGYEERHARV